MAEEKSLLTDAIQIKKGLEDVIKAVDGFVTDGNSKIIGPLSTKALHESKELINRIIEKMHTRADDNE